MKNRGYTLLIDALMSLFFLLLIVTAFFSIGQPGKERTEVMSFKELHYVSEDALEVLNKKGVLDEVATFWAENSTPGSPQMVNASNLSREYLNKIIPSRVGYELVLLDGVDEYPVCNRTLEGGSMASTHSTRVLVGYGKGLPTIGYVSTASLESISEKAGSDYIYFGGFVGQGNITRVLNLPIDADVTSAYMELNPGADFNLYINGQQCGGIYQGVGLNLSAKSWDLSACRDNFTGGGNVIDIKFTGRENNFIGGGYLRVDYKTDEWNRTPELNRYWFPGVEGLIGVYSGFYIPGNDSPPSLQNMEIYLHYANNVEVDPIEAKGATMYLNLAGRDIYKNNTLGEHNVTLKWDDIWPFFDAFNPSIFAQQVSGETVPIKFGTDPFSAIGIKGTADVVLITDLSGSMRYNMTDDGDFSDNETWGKKRNCDDPEDLLYNTSTRRITIAKCLDKIFIETIMEVPGNRMGLVGFNQDANDYTLMNLTEGELLAVVDGYTDEPSGGTCICCAINRAEELMESPYWGNLVSSKSEWRYNTNNPVYDPMADGEGDNWTSLSYNDSGWGVGDAVLGFDSDVDTDIGNNLVESSVNYSAENYSILAGVLTGGSLSDTYNLGGGSLNLKSLMLEGIPDYYEESDVESTNPNPSFVDKTTLLFTPPVNADYLIIGSALIAGKSGCECVPGSGPCCDNDICKFKQTNTICNYAYNTTWRCFGGCGGGVEIGIQQRNCSGSSSTCDGPISPWNWTVFDTCSSVKSCNSTTLTCECDLGCGANCTGGPCCDTSTCMFLPDNNICQSFPQQYDCPWGTDCGDNVGVRQEHRNCSGFSSDCNGALWNESWAVEDDCDFMEMCTPGDPVCNLNASCYNCTPGPGSPCCDPVTWDYMLSNVVCNPSVSKQYACNGIGCGADVISRDQKQNCSGSDAVCNGPLWWGSWMLEEDCNYMETCAAGDSTCNVNISECCDCTVGVCCNLATCQFKTNTSLCGDIIEKRCVGDCAGRVEERHHLQNCSGDSNTCTGATWVTDWVTTKTCDTGYRCNPVTFNCDEDDECVACTDARLLLDGGEFSSVRFEPRRDEDYYPFAGHEIKNLNPVQKNVTVQYRMQVNSPSKIKDARVIALDLATIDHRTAESEVEDTISVNGWVPKVSLNTAGLSGDYLLTASADVTADSIEYSVNVQLTEDGTVLADFSREPTVANEYYTFITHKIINLPDHNNYVIRYRREFGGSHTAKIKNARITLMKLEPGRFHTSEDEIEDLTTSSWKNRTTLTVTPEAEGDYLIIGSAMVKQSSSVVYGVQARLVVEGNPTEMKYYVKDTSDYIPFYTIKKVHFDTSKHDIFLEYGRVDGGIARIRYSRITAIRLSPEYTGVGITVNSTNVSYQGELKSINATVRFKSNTTYYQMMLYNFNTSTWEADGCDARTVTADTWEDFWCHKGNNTENYLSPDNKIRAALGTLETGLVGEWNLDEGSGNTAYDSSKYGNNGTLMNMDAGDWVDGIHGAALDFDGIDDYVQIPNSDKLDITGDQLTLMAWVKIAVDFTNDYGVIVKTATNDYDYVLTVQSSETPSFRTHTSSGTVYLEAAPGIIQIGKWHHLAGVYDGSDMKIYVDGAPVANAPQSGNIDSNTAPVLIGRRRLGDSRFFNGVIDQVRIYDRALSGGEIKAGYETGRSQIEKLNVSRYSQPIEAEVDFIQFYVSSLSGNYYFRQRFDVDNVSDLLSAKLRVYSDDRAEVYLNDVLVDNDLVKHNATYWNREVNVNLGNLQDGENIIAVKLHNYDNESAKFDLELSAEEKRSKFIVVMSDGIPTHHCGGCGAYPPCLGACDSKTGNLLGGDCTGTMEDCTGNDCEVAMEDSICSSSKSGAIVYSIGVGPVTSGCANANTTLQEIADQGGGEYCGSADPKEVEDCYLRFAEGIVNVSFESQIMNISGNFTMDNILYPDSNVWFSYSQAVAPIKHGETLINLESICFGNEEGKGNFSMPSAARAVNAKVTSYSGPYWTDKLKVNSSKTTGWEDVYDLSSYGSSYDSLGDPYTVGIPAKDIGSGMNFVKISTGKNSSESMNASPDDKVIYTIATRLSATSSEPKKKTEGCNWTVEFSNGDKINLIAPPGYSGPKKCNYTSASIVYDEQSSVDDALYLLFKQLDIQPEDGRLDVRFNPDDVTLDLTNVGGIRSLWGPIRVKLILKA